jgi:hypothetical protein
MKDIKYPLDPLDLLQFSLDLNEQLRSISENFVEVSTVLGSLNPCIYTGDLAVNEAVTIISGALFTPAIATPPRTWNAAQWTGDSALDVTAIIEGFIKNGDVYDVIIGILPDELLNVTITILNK